MASRREQRAAGIVQELTGQSYCQALETLRRWTAQGLEWQEELIRLANQKTLEEKKLECKFCHGTGVYEPAGGYEPTRCPRGCSSPKTIAELAALDQTLKEEP